MRCLNFHYFSQINYITNFINPWKVSYVTYRHIWKTLHCKFIKPQNIHVSWRWFSQNKRSHEYKAIYSITILENFVWLDLFQGENFLLLVCGDHGMSDQGSHGGASDSEVFVPAVFLSPLLKSQGILYERKESFLCSLKGEHMVAVFLHCLVRSIIPKLFKLLTWNFTDGYVL